MTDTLAADRANEPSVLRDRTALSLSPALSPITILLIEIALAVGGFGIGTGEFAIMGLLPDVAATYGVSIPQAGYVITSYALGVVIGAPIIAALAARVSRGSLLLMLMSIFAIGNILSAVAPDFATFTALRFVTGLMDVAADAQTLAAASSHAAFNIASALGAWLGGLTIAWGYGYGSTGYVGAALSLLGLAVFTVSVALERKKS
ncbi:MFS transporter [Rhizobium sp. FKY42]|uniref:MFS transporter n=1 Tax=Rhizobium sp. FKY42 TaxID=2562310 RepID=UPI0010C06769|nr:MFS transporter [Rhizobium sp. FKY42]